jgi:uncharacterized protein
MDSLVKSTPVPEADLTRRLLLYVGATYALFWLLLAGTGAAIALGAPPALQATLKNVCAWSPTFALLLLFPRLLPGQSRRAWVRSALRGRIAPADLLAVFALQVLALAGALTAYAFFHGGTLGPMGFVGLAGIAPALLLALTSGATGEELGWRSYALERLQLAFSPLGASLVLGLVWGFWHLPLWLLAGYTGGTLIAYVASFLVAIVSLSVVMTHYYDRSGNVLMAVWIHFWFNFLFGLVANLDLVPIMGYTAAAYLLLATVLVARHRTTLLAPPARAPAAKSAGRRREPVARTSAGRVDKAPMAGRAGVRPHGAWAT